jgi:hypothetical protein
MSQVNEKSIDVLYFRRMIKTELLYIVQKTENLTKDEQKKHLFTLVDCFLKKTVNDGVICDSDYSFFISLFKEITWYSPTCNEKGITVLFTHIFVDLARRYPTIIRIFIEIILNASCYLSPPDKHENVLQKLFNCIMKIFQSTLIPEKDSLYIDQLIFGGIKQALTCVPSIVNGKVFILLSILRIAVESRKSVSSCLRKIIVSIVSNTWQKQTVQGVIDADFRNMSAEDTNVCNGIAFGQSSLSKHSNSNRDHKKKKGIHYVNKNNHKEILDRISERVTDSIYQDHDAIEDEDRSCDKKSHHSKEGIDVDLWNRNTLDMCPYNDIENNDDENYTSATDYNDNDCHTWFREELLFWLENSPSKQLIDIVLSRILSWFVKGPFLNLISQSIPLKSEKNSNNLLLNAVSNEISKDSIFDDVVLDVMNWVYGGIEIIFEDVDISTFEVKYLCLYAYAYIYLYV